MSEICVLTMTKSHNTLLDLLNKLVQGLSVSYPEIRWAPPTVQSYYITETAANGGIDAA